MRFAPVSHLFDPSSLGSIRQSERNPLSHVSRGLGDICRAGWHHEDPPLLPATAIVIQAGDDCLCPDARTPRRVLLLFYTLRCLFSARGWFSAAPTVTRITHDPPTARRRYQAASDVLRQRTRVHAVIQISERSGMQPVSPAAYNRLGSATQHRTNTLPVAPGCRGFPAPRIISTPARTPVCWCIPNPSPCALRGPTALSMTTSRYSVVDPPASIAQGRENLPVSARSIGHRP